jgi:hypothetical protein
MTAIAGIASSIGAYQREASRLSTATSSVTAKVVTRDAGLSLGPFSFQYTATDYEFDLGDTGLTSSFTDALDAAAQAQNLGESMASASSWSSDAPQNAQTLRQALASYQTCQNLPTTDTASRFTATA